MTGRSPARLLAPLALVVCAVALFAIVSSGGGSASDESSASATPSATTKPASRKTTKAKSRKARTYVVKAGDTPSSIAAKQGVSLEDLLDANPDADPNNLKLGQKLKLP